MGRRSREPIGSTDKHTYRSTENQENEIIGLAIDLAEKQIREGTASSQVITHYLKLGSQKAKLEAKKLELENKMIEAKTRSIESEERIEKMYQEAIDAMRRYSGHGDDSNDEKGDKDE